MAEHGSELTAILRASGRGALFATELRALTTETPEHFETELARLRGTELLIVEHGSPDRHVDADLRIVALVGPGGEDAAALVWSEWLRDFLTAHRCS